MIGHSKTWGLSSLTKLLIRPGFGAESLHLGQSKSGVLSTVGKPESITRKYRGQYFLNYPTQGLQVDLGRSTGSVRYLYFFRSGVRGNHAATVATDRGIRPGDTQQKVLKRLGKPQEKGSGVAITERLRLGDWFHYADGMTLEFGDDKRVDMITIARPAKLTSRPSRRVARKNTDRKPQER